MKSKRCIKEIGMVKILLLFNLFTFLPLSLFAEDAIPLRPCRVGLYSAERASAQAPQQQLRRGTEINPYVGNRRQLVVLAAFQDRQFEDQMDIVMDKWDKMFNAENYQEDSFVGSVRDYFYDQSYGQFNLAFDLIYVQLPDSASKYRSTQSDDEYSQYMVDDIVDVLQTLDIDWRVYDWNGDGYVNQILIIYAGMGMNAGGGSTTIWPHQWWLSKHLKNPANQKEGCRGYRTIMQGDKEYRIDCYCCAQEVVNYSGIKTSFGTICHEYSHCFGFPDFYYNSGTKTVGEWDLMDYGNYGGAGFRPCGYSAHERMLMGWITPVELTGETTVSGMPSLSDEPQAYIIRNDAYPDECYMIENRQQRGWDESLPGNGIVIFHVDYDEAIWCSTVETPNSSSKKRYHIFPASNMTSTMLSNLKRWPYPYADNDSLTNYSSPAATLNNANTDGEMLMSKPVTKMSVTDGLASFAFMAPPTTAIPEQKALYGKTQVLYNLGPINIIRCENGEVRKIFNVTK